MGWKYGGIGAGAILIFTGLFINLSIYTDEAEKRERGIPHHDHYNILLGLLIGLPLILFGIWFIYSSSPGRVENLEHKQLKLFKSGLSKIFKRNCIKENIKYEDISPELFPKIVGANPNPPFYTRPLASITSSVPGLRKVLSWFIIL